ncbi:MAG: hypothetical protein QG656_62 [Candidatus Hydrogenedentes bacterium]|nr:hypothetical protein [Candidatus Hydrogenedentota bacterium]
MNLKSIGILLAILAGLCLGYWLMLRSEESGKRETAAAARLFQFEAGDVTSLKVARLGEAPSEAVCDANGQWTITAPNASVAPNQLLWNRVAVALAGLVRQRTLETRSPDWAAYGLDEPVLTVSGATKAGDRVEVAFGVIEPTQLYRYARVLSGGGEDAVFLVDTKAFQELDRPLLDLRERYLFSVGEAGITRLEFALYWQGSEKDAAKAAEKGLNVGDESVAIVVERTGDGPWRMVEPASGPADQEAVGALVKDVQFAVGRDYVDAPESLSDYGLEPPAARITIVSGSGPAQTALFGALDKSKEKGGVYVKRDDKPAVFVMDGYVVSHFPRSLDTFRDRRLFTRPATSLQEIRYQTAETNVVLVNDPEKGWTMTEPAGSEADQTAISSFVARLKMMEAGSFLDELPEEQRAQTGLDAPAIRFVLKAEGETEPVEIKVGGMLPEQNAYYGTQDTGAIVSVSIPAVEDVMWSLLDFRSRQLLRFSKGAAVRLGVTFEGTDYLFEKVHGKWIVRQPEGYQLESQADMDALLDAVNPLTAASIETAQAPADLAPYGLAEPAASVVVIRQDEGEGGNETAVGPLKIGRPADDDNRKRFAVMTGQPEVFRVDQAVMDGIREALQGVRAP